MYKTATYFVRLKSLKERKYMKLYEVYWNFIGFVLVCKWHYSTS